MFGYRGLYLPSWLHNSRQGHKGHKTGEEWKDETAVKKNTREKLRE
jgi:hypothetical protein